MLPEQEIHGTVGYFPCPFESGAYGKLKLHGEIALVFLRHEALGHKL